jgi:hypothetical protein
VQYGKKVTDPLLGHPAGRLDGYWFNVPSGTPSPVIPAPGVVTLIEFIDVGDGMTPEDANARVWMARLRQVHAQYPQLQIVLVSMTQGQFQGKDLWTDPAREAELIHQYLTNQLQLPGMVCVIPMRFHTEPGLTTVPIASPVLDQYRIDPRRIQGREFLVDAGGWIVLDNRTAFDGRYIQRLLAK